MSFALQLPSSLTVGPLAPYKSCVSHSCIVCTCVDRDLTIWFFCFFSQVQNRQEFLTNAWRVITRVNTQAILSCGKHSTTLQIRIVPRLILQEIWMTRSQHHEEFFAFSEVTRSYQLVGCARNRLQFHTVLQKPR